jgi:glycosyltransferase involved in cell wall biosynthesis
VAHLVAKTAMDFPLITVMIPSYNYLHYITTAIESVRSQTYPNVEIIVSDNRSTDGTVPALRERYAGDARVRIFENDTNVGMTGNFNEAYKRATGSFMLWLSADDWLLPLHLERLHDVFERNPQLDIVYSNAYIADALERVYAMRRQAFPIDYVDDREELIEMLTTTCPLCWPTALFRREVFEELGTFDADGPTAADWEMQVRFAINGKKFAYLAEPSCVVRMHDSQVTGTEYHISGKNIIDFVAIIERYLDHPGMRRMHGREIGIANHLDTLLEAGLTLSGGAQVVTPEELERIRRLQGRLKPLAALVPAQVRDWRVSVIVVAQGPVQSTLRLMDAIAAQTFTNYEIVVVDQCVIPLENVLRAHAAWPRMTYARIRTPLTMGTARNFGTRLARGELVAFIDAEDTIDPHHFATLVDTIARAGCEVAAASSRLVLEQVSEHANVYAPLGAAEGIFRGPSDSPLLSAFAHALPLGALLVYRRQRDVAGIFNEQAPVLEDYEWMMRLERATRIVFSGLVTYDVRLSLGLVSSPLSAQLGSYVPMLDLIYATYQAPEAAAERAAHRTALEAFMVNATERVKSVQGLANFAGTLAGRTVLAVQSA